MGLALSYTSTRNYNNNNSMSLALWYTFTRKYNNNNDNHLNSYMSLNWNWRDRN